MRLFSSGKNTTGEITTGVDASTAVSKSYGQNQDYDVKCYPTAAAGVTCTSTTTAWTAGSWTEIVPASTITKDILIIGLGLKLNNIITSQREIEIGTGGAGSETVRAIIPASLYQADDTGYFLQGILMLAAPIKVAANARIAVRANDDTTTALGNICKIVYLEMS